MSYLLNISSFFNLSIANFIISDLVIFIIPCLAANKIMLSIFSIYSSVRLTDIALYFFSLVFFNDAGDVIPLTKSFSFFNCLFFKITPLPINSLSHFGPFCFHFHEQISYLPKYLDKFFFQKLDFLIKSNLDIQEYLQPDALRL